MKKWQLQFKIMSKEPYSLKDKFLMAYFLLVCGYYDLKMDLTNNIFLERGYNSMYLTYWNLYKQIYYKSRD
jgi:hypothetical protein